MTYSIKEIYLTLQGEGAQTGRLAVFCRFSGCNLWSGHEKDRPTAACNFCDTDFVGTDGPGGGRYRTAVEVAERIKAVWDADALESTRPYVVFTGGEPTLQLDGTLVRACREREIEVAIETNGTRQVPNGVDWICVSPKPGSQLVQRFGSELKLVYPQSAISPTDFAHLEFDHFFLQPMAGDAFEHNLQAAIGYCRSHPRWRLSIQTHKLIGIP
jgi:7-carboxy-7-deazaguanine synthase